MQQGRVQPYGAGGVLRPCWCCAATGRQRGVLWRCVGGCAPPLTCRVAAGAWAESGTTWGVCMACIGARSLSVLAERLRLSLNFWQASPVFVFHSLGAPEPMTFGGNWWWSVCALATQRMCCCWHMLALCARLLQHAWARRASFRVAVTGWGVGGRMVCMLAHTWRHSGAIAVVVVPAAQAEACWFEGWWLHLALGQRALCLQAKAHTSAGMCRGWMLPLGVLCDAFPLMLSLPAA